MDLVTMALLAIGMFIIFPLVLLILHDHWSCLPPGPFLLLLALNILKQGSHATSHQTISALASKYGPLMTLRLGKMRTVVISSPDVAREMYKVHDLALAGRTIYEAMKVEVGEPGSQGSIITAQYGPSWRLLRRLCTLEFFSTPRLAAMKTVRRECMDSMIKFIREESENGKKAVEVSKFIFLMNFNLLGNHMFSRNLVDPKCKEGNEFFYHARTVMELLGKPNLADFVPFLKWFDPQGIKGKMYYHLQEIYKITSGFTRERIQTGSSGSSKHGKKRDYLDVLLSFEGDGRDEPAKFSPTVINTIALEMLIAGTDTTTSTTEWALAEVMRNPVVMTKLVEELLNVVGTDRQLEEDDLDSLPYLRAVIKETLRMHPPLPMMVPHRAMESCTMMGYHIPKDTQVLINAWAIGRDPHAWVDPHSFNPERFLDSTVDYRGQHFEYIPFGSGRRICPGLPLAHKMLPFTLGSLLLSFDWVRPEGRELTGAMDMSEKMGITLRKGRPLTAIPLPRAGGET